MQTPSRRSLFGTSIFASFALIVAGTLLILQPSKQPADIGSPHGGQSAPSSAKPSETNVQEYTVAPDLPRYISIPAINVSRARVIHLGLTDDNQIASPDNIFDAGWYNGSAKPGTSGAMFIYGHVSNWTANGLFHDLKKLVPGDSITVTQGNGRTSIYIVRTTKVYDAKHVDMAAVLRPVDDSKPGLNLMTCAGSVIKDTNDFSERLVVFASLSQ